MIQPHLKKDHFPKNLSEFKFLPAPFCLYRCSLNKPITLFLKRANCLMKVS